MKRCTIQHLPPFASTEYILGRNILSSFSLDSPSVVIADRTVAALYQNGLLASLKCEWILIPSGEEGKTRSVKEAVEDQLLKSRYGSDTTLIAIGGGTTSDLTGFIAATYHRGIGWISVPTTLVGMVDASIGGKTGINTSEGKNVIGAFHPPKKVIAELAFLDTLPAKEKINGLAEVYKMGLVSEAWPQSDQIEELIWNAVIAKKKIVEADPYPRERGLRRVLNFGHTIGHALETLSNYALSHGEAVILGCLAESYLSFQLGHLSEAAFREVQTLYKKLSPQPRLPTQYTRQKALLAMQGDKKNAGRQIRMVLLEDVGRAISFGGEYCGIVSPAEVEQMLAWLEQLHA